jgi:hypothetical protein
VRTDLSYTDTHAIDGAATGSVAGDLRAFAARVWRDAPDYQRFVYSVSLAILLAGTIHAIIWAVLGGSWTETISWRKPTLFFLSSGVTVLISTYAMNFLKLTRRRGWQLGLAILTPAFVVGALISVQQFRGTRSHFNFFQSPFDAAVAGSIAFIISLFIPALAILGVMTFRSLRPGVPKSLALAVRAGIVMINVGSLLGLVTILNGATNGLLFTMQVPSVIGAAGTTKVAHGVPLHGIQVFLLVFALMSYTGWSERRKIAVLLPAVAGYAGLIAVFVFQAFNGREPFDFTSGTIAAVGIFATLVIASVTTAAAGAASGIRRGVRSDIIPSIPWAPAAPGGLPAPGGVRGFFDRSLLRAAGGLLLVVGGFVSFATIVGLNLSPKLVFERAAWFDAPPEQVWALVTNHVAEPEWRRDLTSVNRIPSGDGQTAWREQYWSYQRIDLATTERTVRPGREWRLEAQMSFHELPVLAGGLRVVDVAASGRGTRVRMTEEKTVRFPPFRTWARVFVMPQLSTVTPDRYLAALGARLGKAPRYDE